MANFEQHDIAAYQGKEIKVLVSKGNHGESLDKPHFVRGCSNVNTTEERPETRVSEMGVDISKVIYGIANFSASVTLTVRDLYQIAKLTGADVGGGTIDLNKFDKVNLVQWFEEPDTDDVNMTRYIGGFQSRTNSMPTAADALATTTLEGGSDMISYADGKCLVEEWTIDSDTDDKGLTVLACYTDLTASTLTLIENPAGIENSTGTLSGNIVTFDAKAGIARIVYEIPNVAGNII